MGALTPSPRHLPFLRTLHLLAGYTSEVLWINSDIFGFIKMSNTEITKFYNFTFLLLRVYHFHYVYRIHCVQAISSVH